MFDGNGEKRGAEILVNTDTAGQQLSPALTALSDGRIVVTWHTLMATISAQIIDPRDGLIYGTANGDTLYGHATVNDEINGLDGADTIFGLGGNDQVHAGSGTDNVTLARGDDVAYGGAGNDVITGGNGEDVLYGEGDNDNLSGGKGEDELFGGAGNDTLNGNNGDDIIAGGAGNDTIFDGEGGCHRWRRRRRPGRLCLRHLRCHRRTRQHADGGGGAAGDSYVSVEILAGSNFADILRGSAVANVIFGRSGDDRITARAVPTR